MKATILAKAINRNKPLCLAWGGHARSMLPSIGRVFIRVYRLAIDARPKRGDGGADRKYPSMLEDFQTSTKSMARKRHLASIARGFLCFCLTPATGLIRSIRLIRGRKRIQRTRKVYPCLSPCDGCKDPKG